MCSHTDLSLQACSSSHPLLRGLLAAGLVRQQDSAKHAHIPHWHPLQGLMSASMTRGWPAAAPRTVVRSRRFQRGCAGS